MIKSGKKNKRGHFLVVVQLSHRLMQADISCTTTARMFFFPLLGKKASLESRVEGQISQTIFSHLLPLSRRRESSWAREMGRGSANTVQVTDSAHGGVVSDPEYLLHWQEHFQN